MDQVNDITQAISELPAGGMIPVGLALIAGLLLWAAGRRILRVTFVITGFVLGCTVGWLVGELLGLGMEIVVPAIVGGIVFACVAGLASRLVVAVALALTLGIAAPLATMSLAQLRGPDEAQPSEEQIADPQGGADQLPDDVAEWLDKFDPDAVETAPSGDPSVENPPADSPTGSPPDFLPDLRLELPPALRLDSATESVSAALEIPEQARRYVDHIQQIAKQLKNAVKAKWDATPASARPSVVGSALGGLLVGMLLGALARAFSAVVVTAFSGSILWLTCAWTLAHNLGAPEGPWMPGSSASWITWWLITSVIGLVVQWTLRRKPVDKPAEQ